MWPRHTANSKKFRKSDKGLFGKEVFTVWESGKAEIGKSPLTFYICVLSLLKALIAANYIVAYHSGPWLCKTLSCHLSFGQTVTVPYILCSFLL